MGDRQLRSFGRIQGRKLTAEKQDLIDNLLPEFSIDIEKASNIENIFNNNKFKDYCMEIGFGGGEHLVGIAKTNPDTGFIGCEPFTNGVASCLKQIKSENPDNIKLFHGDARLLIEKLPENSLNRVFILFPDPWPKFKHHKKRIINNELFKSLSRVIAAGGSLEIATDHVEYTQWIEEEISSQIWFLWQDWSKNNPKKPPEDWIETRYQQKALKEGRTANFFICERQSN
ncbi:tRNA (guanosine(46)-N7)-methyltransferase TrmB [Rickettsiales bacterium]|nr:tRNA (guanosine(46)-N7)-methyltransferase TrmB [Rickettsiales bacterium]